MNIAIATCSIPDCYINRIITGHARELAAAIPNNSVDLVFCDPPYLKKDVEGGIYAWLAREAARVLKPGEFCLAYCPTHWKPTALSQTSEHLTYFWDYIDIQMGDGNGLAWGRRTQICYVSILAFQKAGARVMPLHSIMVVYHADRANKRYHKWGQSEIAAQYYVDCFTRPGDLVVDFFAGGGTIPLVCKQLGREYIACEIDPQTAEIARKRIAHVQPFLLGLHVKQQSLELEV